jgi:hypothetical protein
LKTHIKTESFSAVSAVSVNNVFSATYTDYVVKTYMRSSAGGPSINMRMRVGGVDNSTGSSYKRHRMLSLNTGNFNGDTVDNNWQVGLSNNVDTRFPGSFIVSRPFEAVSTGVSGTMGYDEGSQLFHGFHNQSVSYDGFSLIVASGNITGKIVVYGLAE